MFQMETPPRVTGKYFRKVSPLLQDPSGLSVVLLVPIILNDLLLLFLAAQSQLLVHGGQHSRRRALYHLQNNILRAINYRTRDQVFLHLVSNDDTAEFSRSYTFAPSIF